jgi:hypothetical protein
MSPQLEHNTLVFDFQRLIIIKIIIIITTINNNFNFNCINGK